MKLHSPDFESDVKRRIRAAIRTSPALKHEYRRAKRHSRLTNLQWLWRCMITGLLAFVVSTVYTRTGHWTTALAALAVYLAAAVFFRIQNLWALLQNSPDNLALTILPAATETIFQWQFQKFVRQSLHLLLDLLAGFAVLAVASGCTPWAWLLFLGDAVWVWFGLLALAVLGALRIPRVAVALTSAGIVVAGFILFFCRSILGPPVLHFLDQYNLNLLVILPTGWALAPMELVADGSRWWLFALWVPVAFLIWRSRDALPVFSSGMEFQEFIVPPARDRVPGEEPAFLALPERSRPLGLTEIEEILASGTYLISPGFVLRDFPERKLWRWLTPRQRVLAEFVHPNGMPIGATWRRLFAVQLGAMLLIIVGRFMGPTAELVTLGLGCFLVFCLQLGALVNHGSAFSLMAFGGIHVPLYAGYGVGFQELTGFFLKHSLVQAPFLVPAMTLLGAEVAWSLRFPLEMGAFAGLKLATVTLALRFILLVFAFSSGTNDTSRFKVSAVLLIFIMALLGLAFLFLAALAILTPAWPPALLFWGGTLLDAGIFFQVYSLFFRFGRFDLMAMSRQ